MTEDTIWGTSTKDDDGWAFDTASDSDSSGFETFLAPEVEDAEADGPGLLGRRWRDVEDAAEKRQLWIELRRWVDWLYREHSFSKNEIPPCWFRHSDITAELYAAMCAEYKVWEEGAPSTQPFSTWLPYLASMRERIKNKADRCIAENKHVPPHSFNGVPAGRIVYDEGSWQSHLLEVEAEETVEIGESGSWRFSVRDENGEVHSSEPVQVKAVKPEVHVEVEAAELRTDAGLGQSTVIGRARGAGIERVWFEVDRGEGFQVVETSRLDVSEQNAEDGE